MQKWASYTLILLIALQSLMSVADTHQVHQSDTGHLEFIADDPKEPIQPLANVMDCQHCCHCHSFQLNFLMGNVSFVPREADNQSAIHLTLSVSDSYFTSLYRPPKI